MPTDKSIAEVEELKTLLREAKLIISTDFRGLSVTEMSALRRAVREGGGTYRVAKNTLVSIASKEIGRPEIDKIVVGPTGFVLSTDDPIAPARALMAHIQQNRLAMVINGAYLEGQIVDADRVQYLATLPGREELVARVLGQMNAPIANLVSVLSGTMRGLMTVLLAHIDQGGNAGIAGRAEASTEEADGPADSPADDPAAAVTEAPEEAPAEQDAESAEESVAEVPEEEKSSEEGESERTGEAVEDTAVAQVEVAEEAQTEQAEESAEEPAAETTTEEEPTPETPESEDAGEADEDKPAE